MTFEEFLHKLNNTPEQIEFEDTMAQIDHAYDFTPTAFKNGEIENKAGENNGSCKLLYFAMLNRFSREQTVSLFGKYFREDVLLNKEGDDHQNIRNFMKTGPRGVEFEGTALIPKQG